MDGADQQDAPERVGYRRSTGSPPGRSPASGTARPGHRRLGGHSVKTPNGSVGFLQVVGITADELERMQQSSTAAVLRELAGQSPNLVTDPAR